MVIIIPIATIASSCSSTSIKLNCCRGCSTVRRTCCLMLMMITILMVVMVMVGEMVVVMVSRAEEITSCGWYVVTLTIFFTWGKFWIYYNSGCRGVMLVMIR